MTKDRPLLSLPPPPPPLSLNLSPSPVSLSTLLLLSPLSLASFARLCGPQSPRSPALPSLSLPLINLIRVACSLTLCHTAPLRHVPKQLGPRTQAWSRPTRRRQTRTRETWYVNGLLRKAAVDCVSAARPQRPPSTPLLPFFSFLQHAERDARWKAAADDCVLGHAAPPRGQKICRHAHVPPHVGRLEGTPVCGAFPFAPWAPRHHTRRSPGDGLTFRARTAFRTLSTTQSCGWIP